MKNGLTIEPIEDILVFHSDYYSNPIGRALLHNLKQNDKYAIRIIAQTLSTLVPEESIIVPVPNRYGFAKSTLALAESIATLKNITVENILTGRNRPSLYNLKKANIPIGSNFFQFSVDQQQLITLNLVNKPIYLLDGVIGTGLTMLNCLQLIPQAKMLVYAVDFSNFGFATEILKYDSRQNKEYRLKIA